MKYIMSICFLCVLAACEVEEATPTTPINDEFDPTKATLLKGGMMMGVGHSVSGTASLYEQSGKKIVLLDPFQSQNGPDLKVYLSKDEAASSYISLGALKSTTGKQSYEVPGNPDVTDYEFVLVWCEQFTVIFGKAPLK